MGFPDEASSFLMLAVLVGDVFLTSDVFDGGCFPSEDFFFPILRDSLREGGALSCSADLEDDSTTADF